MDHIIGSVSLTLLTHPLSFQILETNSNSIDVGRTISLLNLQEYPPSEIPDPSYFRDGKYQT